MGSVPGAPAHFFQDTLAVSASPPFSWGRAGNVTTNAWLYNEQVPSNRAGRLVYLNNASIIKVFVSNDGINTFDIGVYEHTGGLPSLIGTVSIVAKRADVFTVAFNVTTLSEVAMRVTSGSAKNLIVGAQLAGDLI